MAHRLFGGKVLGFVFWLAVVALSAAPIAAADESSVEYRLAVIQVGGYVAPNDPLVVAYANALDKVQPRCNETRLQLGSVALALTDKLHEQGFRDATPLSLLKALDAAATPDVYSSDNTANCAEILALVAYLASQGD